MTVRTAHSPETAEIDLRALVREIGPGFHPDTPGTDYVNLPARWENRRDVIDETVRAAFEHGLDPYGIALDVLGIGDGQVVPCPEHPAAGVLLVETGYTRTWRYDPETRAAYDDSIDWESGAGDDHPECPTCLRPLLHSIDFAEVNWS